ncbi:hypothetical protein [Falsiroseomonas tokyonensis]|uniref:Uncharacterized protein n=1 Tax=Falsiroseomonas tokyonensis TaxID=430521 RepID=A0ABV7BZE0_9PROT|nr:hypothetical protein [Falsiroseomonas tokyonensis]MBU8540001.1 hypothetical protein [Falsiroseomonas tokyonensis]
MMARPALRVVRTAGLCSPSQEAVTRGRSFMARRATWRAEHARFYASDAALAPCAADILAEMFNAATRVFVDPPCYALRAIGEPSTVNLNAETWKWSTADGTAAGTGLHELWAWRFDMPVHLAAAEIMALVRDHRVEAERSA